MNRYQKQLNKEVKHFIKDKNPRESFNKIRTLLKSNDAKTEFSLCNCCYQPCCNLTKNKLFYCKNWE